MPSDAPAYARTHPLENLALQLLVRNPDMPAAELLRRAGAEHAQSGCDFESHDAQGTGRHPAYVDEMYPPSPFAEVLRRAYCPTLGPREALLLGLDVDGAPPELAVRIAAAEQRWQREVIEPFFETFGLEG